MTIKEIDYNYIIELTKFFVTKYYDNEIKNLDSIISNIKYRVPSVKEMSYTFDESIWPPDQHDDVYYKLIEFRVQLVSELEYLPFRLFIDKGFDQETIFIDGNYNWVY